MASNDYLYVVYPYAADRYQAVKVHARFGNAAIHQAIAKFENDESQSKRRWATPIEVGSFNIAKIADADTAADAIEQAKAQGLAYEPKLTVLARYEQRQEGLKRDFERTRSGGAPSDPLTRAFDEIFGDILGKRGPKP